MASTLNADNGVVSGSAGLKSSADSTGVLALQTNGTTAVTINTSQNVGIGTSSPSSVSGYRSLNIKSTNGGELQLGNTAGTAQATLWCDASGVTYNNHGSTAHIWNTGGAERMRIDSSGNLLVGTTSGTSHKLFKDNAASISTQIYNSSTNTSSSAMEVNVNYTGNTTGWFIRGGDSAVYRFYIYSNGNITNTNNSYGAISDAKLKENIVDATPKLNSLMQVRVVNYNLIGEEGKQLGVVAQELEQVFPSMVDESPDYEPVTTTDEDGNEQVEQVATGTTTKSVKYSVFVPMLIKAIQEQQALINNLTERLTALEGAQA